MTKINCTICDKKINSMYKQIFTCRCKHIFCTKHLNDHSCTYDYKTEYKKTLSNETVIAAKLRDKL